MKNKETKPKAARPHKKAKQQPEEKKQTQVTAAEAPQPQPSEESVELNKLYELMKKYDVRSISDVENKLARLQ
jgi:hypothetical protein